MPKKAACRRCSETLLVGRGSLPNPMCHPCRRIEPQRASKGSAPKTRRPRAVRPSGATSLRGYGTEHQYQRAVALQAFVPGEPCARCREPMLAADPLDLDHTEDRDGYLGLSHRWCNRSHKPNGTPRSEVFERRRSCVICDSEYRASYREQRACNRVCGVAWKKLNAA